MREKVSWISGKEDPVVGRTCTTCDEWKPADCYYARTESYFALVRVRLDANCNDCKAAVKRSSARNMSAEDRERVREYKRRWEAKHHDERLRAKRLSGRAIRAQAGAKPRNTKARRLDEQIDNALVEAEPLLPLLERTTATQTAKIMGLEETSVRKLRSGEYRRLRLDAADRLLLHYGESLATYYPEGD